jgi:hypothetical protein
MSESYACQFVALVDLLTRDPESEVKFLPDGTYAVEVRGVWTDRLWRRFHGETRLLALQAAYSASREKVS